MFGVALKAVALAGEAIRVVAVRPMQASPVTSLRGFNEATISIILSLSFGPLGLEYIGFDCFS